ncbi:MAG: hypothetical protein AB4060_17315 [Crocosphaera sp.]
MKRIVEFSHKHQVNIRLAYYPPYRGLFMNEWRHQDKKNLSFLENAIIL